MKARSCDIMSGYCKMSLIDKQTPIEKKEFSYAG